MKTKWAVTIVALLLSTTANAQLESGVKPKPKLPTINGTYTPPPAVDWGCGKGRAVTVREDGDMVCPIAVRGAR